MNPEKIKLQAIIDKDSKLHVVDQDGRPFDFRSEHSVYKHTQEDQVVQIRVELEAPYWPELPPHVEVTFRVPLQVESERTQELIDSMSRFYEPR